MHRAGGRESLSCSPRSARWLGLVLSLLLVARANAMHPCGDDIDGHGKHVACSCGDLLVSSHTLTPADHVTHGACPGSGLLVAADGPVTLDLNGRTVSGSGQGAGVVVLRGRLDLVGPGTIDGFENGVLARGSSALGSVMAIRAAHNRLDGFFAEGDGYTIQGSVAEENGRDGFALGGSAYAIDGNRATGNHRYGFNAWGMGAHLGGGLGNEAEFNGMVGFYLRGMMHEMVGATAAANNGEGIMASVMHTLFTDMRAAGNAGDGLHLMGMGLAIGASNADDNRGYGIWVMGMDVDDRGGNHGAGNAGLVGLAGTPSVRADENPALVQCRMGMMTECR